MTLLIGEPEIIKAYERNKQNQTAGTLSRKGEKRTTKCYNQSVQKMRT